MLLVLFLVPCRERVVFPFSKNDYFVIKLVIKLFVLTFSIQNFF